MMIFFTGLYPFDVEAVNYEKILQLCEPKDPEETEVELSKHDYLEHIINKLDSTLLPQFKEFAAEKLTWNGDDIHTSLFEVWHTSLKEQYAIDDNEQVQYDEVSKYLNSNDGADDEVADEENDDIELDNISLRTEAILTLTQHLQSTKKIIDSAGNVCVIQEAEIEVQDYMNQRTSVIVVCNHRQPVDRK